MERFSFDGGKVSTFVLEVSILRLYSLFYGYWDRQSVGFLMNSGTVSIELSFLDLDTLDTSANSCCGSNSNYACSTTNDVDDTGPVLHLS